jgi:hypothetical protein
MNSQRILLNLFLSLFLISCSSNVDTTENNINTKENTKALPTHSIVGDWYKSIEPGTHAFLEDGTLNIHLPGEETEKGEIVIRAKWEIKEDQLVIKLENQDQKAKKLQWISDDQFYWGDDYDPELHSNGDAEWIFTRYNEVANEAENENNLLGIWYFTHEPACMEFKEDGTYREFVEEGMLDPDAPAEVFAVGKWSLSDNVLKLSKKDDSAHEEMKIVWISKDKIYFQDWEESEIDADEMEEMSWVRK